MVWFEIGIWFYFPVCKKKKECIQNSGFSGNILFELNEIEMYFFFLLISISPIDFCLSFC